MIRAVMSYECVNEKRTIKAGNVIANAEAVEKLKEGEQTETAVEKLPEHLTQFNKVVVESKLNVSAADGFAALMLKRQP
jgi:ABC-type branched-subunit amino acid transport system ATPase component